MYRKQMRMSQVQTAEPAATVNSRFIQHLAQIPTVFLVWNIATETYQIMKTSNKFLSTSLSSVEKVAGFVSKKAEPLVQKLEPQLKVIDDIALRGLEKLEQTIPVVAGTPGNIIRYTKTKYDEMVESGLQKYQDVKSSTISTAKDISEAGVEHSNEFLNSPYGELFLMAVNSIFDAYEMYLDRILPPFGDEGPVAAFGDRDKSPVLERADSLTERLKERLYKHTLLQIQNLRLRSKLTFNKFYKTNVLQSNFHS